MHSLRGRHSAGVPWIGRPGAGRARRRSRPYYRQTIGRDPNTQLPIVSGSTTEPPCRCSGKSFSMDGPLPQILSALFLQASIRICRLCIRRDVSREPSESPPRREIAGRIWRRTISPDDPRHRLIITSSAIGRFPRTRGPRSRERSRYASPPFGPRSLTQTSRALATTFPRADVRVMF